jgi:hypothetical protein
MTTAKAPHKRRNTMNSRNTIYEEEMALALKLSKMEAPDDEEEEDAVPVVVVGPRKRRKRSAPASVPEQDESYVCPPCSIHLSPTLIIFLTYFNI